MSEQTKEKVGHTPGPWTRYGADHTEIVGPDGICVASCHIPSGPNRPVGGVRDTQRHKAEGQANARLIAAAPELLEAAKEAEALVVSMWGEGGGKSGEVREALRAAIAKAEGES